MTLCHNSSTTVNPLNSFMSEGVSGGWASQISIQNIQFSLIWVKVDHILWEHNYCFSVQCPLAVLPEICVNYGLSRCPDGFTCCRSSRKQMLNVQGLGASEHSPDRD